MPYRNSLLAESAQTDPERTIIREIEFEPQYKQAGMGILNYFSEVLNQKYPDLDVKVNIRQDGLKVQMEIETPEGKKELIEEMLVDYGLVVTGQKPPEELIGNNELKILEFKYELRMAQNRIETQNEMLQIQGAKYEEMIGLLKEGLEDSRDARKDVKDIAKRAFKLQKEGKLSTFDQRGQQVNYQYNAAGNIYIGSAKNRADLVKELEKLQAELDGATKAGVLDEDTATDAEYQLKKAVQQAKKPDADKNSILDFLNKGKTLIESVKAASGLVQGLGEAADKVKELF